MKGSLNRLPGAEDTVLSSVIPFNSDLLESSVVLWLRGWRLGVRFPHWASWKGAGLDDLQGPFQLCRAKIIINDWMEHSDFGAWFVWFFKSRPETSKRAMQLLPYPDTVSVWFYEEVMAFHVLRKGEGSVAYISGCRASLIPHGASLTRARTWWSTGFLPGLQI